MIYVSIDLETTGLDWTKHQVLEIAAIAQQLGGEELGRFRTTVWHPEIVGSPFALSMHPRLIEEIVSGAPDSGEALEAFRQFLDLYAAPADVGSTPRVIAAGKNFATFDQRFIEMMQKREGFEDRWFHRRVLDPSILYMSEADDVPPSTSLCAERAGLNVDPGERHVALEDAEIVRDLIETWWAGQREDFEAMIAEEEQ